VRRPGQRLDADGRAHRLPGGGHSRLLAGHQGGTVRAGCRALADAGSHAAGGPARPVPDVRSPGSATLVNPRSRRQKLGHGVLVTLVASILAAYAVGRLRPPGFRWWRRVIFATYVIPQTILFVPLYQVVIRLQLDDNLLALLLVYPTMALPFCIWILSAYFQQLPREVEEAALIEGASRTTAFLKIILPMSRPVIVTAGIFALGTIASDFMIASVFLLSLHHQTIPAGLATMDVALDELVAVAGINVMAIPVIVICTVFAR